MVATGGGLPSDFSAADYAKAVSEKCAALSIKYLGNAESILNCIRADDDQQLADVIIRADGKERGLMLLLACIHGAFNCVFHLKEGFAVEYVDTALGDGIPGCSSPGDLAAHFGHYDLTTFIEYLDDVGGGAAFDLPSPLFEAAYQHPNGRLECLLRNEDIRRSINTASSQGLIPLMVASASSVPLLVEAGADVNVVHGDKGTALYHACHFASLEKVRALVECGADENRASPEGKTPLMVAADKTQANIVAYLLGRPGIDIEAKADDGNRAINFACYRKHVGMVKLLVGAGAKVNVQSTDEESSPLVSAVLGGDLQMVKYLVECGADVTYRYHDGETSLMLAARDGHIDVVEYLLGRSGVNIEAKNKYGERAIDIACRIGHLDVVKMLIAAGANSEPQGKYEQGALAAAARWGSLQVVRYLVEETEADENCAGHEGWTPLMSAAQRGEVDVIQYLLDRPGVNMDAKSDEGERAIDIACCEGHVEVMKLLVAAGARVDPQDSDAVGALMSAVRGGKLDVVKYLVEEAGADANRTGRVGVTPLTWARRTCQTDIANYLQTVVSQREHEALKVAEERAAAAAAALLEEEEKEAAAKEASTKKKKKKGKKKGGAAVQEQGSTSTLEASEIPDDTQTLSDSLASTTIAGEGFSGPREEDSTGGGSVVGGADPEKPGGQKGRFAGVPSQQVDCKRTSPVIEDSDESGVDPALLEGLSCPITHQVMTDPVVADDGHTYEQAAIEEWINKCIADKRPVTSPITGASMGMGLKLNLLARSLVQNIVRIKFSAHIE